MDYRANGILASLPDEEFERLAPHLEEAQLPFGSGLESGHRGLEFCYFPLSGIISLLLMLQDGGSGEIALVGREGMLGVAAVMGGDPRPTITPVVQAPGRALCLPVRELRRAFQRCPGLRWSLLRYIQALLMQYAQTVLCNRHHSLEQQLARWLLLSLDRVDGERVVMTQEMIANMLGVRREGVNFAARGLREQGIISYSRGNILVADPERLRGKACECYRVIRRQYADFLSPGGQG